MVKHFCHPVYVDVLDRLVMHGALNVNLAGYLKDPYVFQRSVWMPPGMESIDPLKESKANTDQVQNLLRSPQEICRSRGRDLEDVLDELKEFKRMCADRGLEPQATSTAIAQNPASLGVEE
jgi:capsid protein